MKTQGLPLGMNASGYATSLLKKALARFGEGKILETGWGRVFEGVPPSVALVHCPSPANLRFTLDYEEDYRFFSSLLELEEIVSGRVSEPEIVKIVLSRGLDRITQPIVDEYWKNFYANIENEKRRETG